MIWKVNPLEGKTINWRAGCGKTASPVRREGEPNPIGSPYPYKLSFPVLTRESFPLQLQPKLNVFMSPQRQLGGAQLLASNQKRLNMFCYCWMLFSGTAFCLLTHQLALVA